jgi:hypothetical protein
MIHSEVLRLFICAQTDARTEELIGVFLTDLVHRKSVRYTGLQNYKIIPLTNLP